MSTPPILWDDEQVDVQWDDAPSPKKSLPETIATLRQGIQQSQGAEKRLARPSYMEGAKAALKSGPAKFVKGALLEGGDIIKAIPQLVTSSDSDPENVRAAGEVAGIAGRMGAGYYNATRDVMDKAEQAAAEGNTPKSMLMSTAAGIPLLGPGIAKVYETAEAGESAEAAGRGLTQIALARLGTKSSPSKGPGFIAKKMGDTAKGVEDFVKPPDAASALDAALPAKSNVVTKQLANRAIGPLRQTAAQLKLKASDFAGPEGPRVLNKVIEETTKSIDDVHQRYLDPVREVPEPLPPMTSSLRKSIVKAAKASDEALGQRIEIGATTMNDFNLIRGILNQMTESSYSSAKVYTPAQIGAAKNFGKELRLNYYNRLEALNQLPKGSLSRLKRMEGDVYRIRNLAMEMEADVSKASSLETTRTKWQKTGDLIGRARAWHNPEQSVALMRKGVGVGDNTGRLLEQAFRDVESSGIGRAWDADLPPPTTITLRSSVASNPQAPSFVRARVNQPPNPPQFGGPQDIPVRPAPPVAPFIPVEPTATPTVTRLTGRPFVSAPPAPPAVQGARLPVGQGPQPALPYEMIDPPPIGALPPMPKPGIPLGPVPPDKLILKQPPAPAIESPMVVTNAKSIVVRDPKTGKMKRMYLTGTPPKGAK